ncbi:MAG: type II secretion system F family protein [Pseudohongiellaceae bacterium]
MARFEYKARNASGNLMTGTMDAASADAVAGELAGQSATPIDIREVARPSRKSGPELTPVEKINDFLAGNKVKVDELIIFARQMYSLTKAGMPLDRALIGLKASLKNKLFSRILDDVVDGLESGLDLSTSLGRHPKTFSPLFLALVNVGENTGRLDLAFEQIGRYLELERDTRKQVKAATRYPMFVIVVIAVALAVITVFVIPAFSDTFDRLGAELPLETRILIGISEFVVQWWQFMLGATVAAVFGFRAWLKTPKGRHTWDRRKLEFPLVGGILERIALARFSRAFAMIMRAGVPIVHGMSVVAGAVGNTFIAGRIEKMRDGISRGESLHRTANNAGMFSPLVLQMIAVGEESGSIDELMFEVADFYDTEVEYDLKRLGDSIEPILIMFIAAMVLVLALGVFLPIWDLGAAAL